MTDLVPFDPRAVGVTSPETRVSWSARDSMLYALGVGAGVEDLAYTTNNTRGVEQRALPTMPVTLGIDFSVLNKAGTFDWSRLLHAEQSVEVLADLPVDGSATCVTRLTEMWDKDKAALVTVETTGSADDGTVLWRSAATLFIKGVGGWGGDRGPATEPIVLDDNAKTISYETHVNQALVYRLSGDYNPLHSDPSFAAKAGLDRPILHGLCTFGFAGRAVLEVAGDRSVRSVSARFASPVWPGDTLAVDLDRPDEDTVHFVVRGKGGAVVLSNGIARLG